MKIKFLLFLLFSGIISGFGQNIMEIIERGSNSVLNVDALNKNGSVSKSSILFFISSDGLAITNSSLMQDADSIVFTDNRGRKIELNRIVAVHSFANLALVHLRITRQHNFNFFSPSKIPYGGESEILAFINQKDTNDGLAYGKIENVRNCIIGGRVASIRLQGGAASDCAPIIDESGNFIGIYRFAGSNQKGTLFPASLITDTAWVSVNQTWTDFKHNPEREKLTTPQISNAIINMSDNKWRDAAQNLTSVLRNDAKNATLLALRALSRFSYGNNTGGNEDFNNAIEINPNEYIAYYARAISRISNKDNRNALSDLLLATDKKSDFALGYLEIGKIQVQQNEIRNAFASFTFSIQNDSVLDEAWYERGKLMLLHSSNLPETLNDLSAAAKLNPTLNGVFYMMGSIKLRQQKYVEAILDFDKAIQKSPHDTNALLDRGMAYYYNGATGRACEDWENAAKKGNTQAIRMIRLYCKK